jgi:plastocyanin
MRRAPLASLMLLAALAALAGCGGSDEDGSRGSLTVKSGEPVLVKGYEYGFEPGTITIRANNTEVAVQFELTNEGSLPHDLHVRKGDEELGGTEAIGEGKKARTTTSIPPGDYEFYCSIGDHADLGMKGKLTVE